MRYEIILSPEAIEDLQRLKASRRSTVRDALEQYLMKKVPLTEVKNDLSKYLRLAEQEEVVITRHGKAAGVLIGFESEDDWIEYRLERDPRFLQRIEAARQSLNSGRGVRLEDVEDQH